MKSAAFIRADGKAVVFLWLAIAGWQSRTRTALPPVTQVAKISLTSQPRQIVAHRFADEGRLIAENVSSEQANQFNVPVSDQVVAIEID